MRSIIIFKERILVIAFLYFILTHTDLYSFIVFRRYNSVNIYSAKIVKISYKFLWKINFNLYYTYI